jgi:hypothetical protein
MGVVDDIIALLIAQWDDAVITTANTDFINGVLNTNPVILDSSGRTPFSVYLDESIIYTEVLAPATDTDPPTSPIYTQNGITKNTGFCTN